MNSIIHITKPLKIKHVDVTSSTSIDFHKENNKADTKFEVNDHVKILKYKTIFSKFCVGNWPEEVFVIKKVNGDKVVGTFCEKELQKTNQTEFRVEKVIKRNEISCMSNGKDVIILSTVGLIKKILLYKRSYFPEPYTRCINKIKFELDLSNYATKSDLKMATSVNTSKFAEKS